MGNDKAFYGSRGRLFREFVKGLQGIEEFKQVKLYYTYASLAAEEDPSKVQLDCCRPRLYRELDDVACASNGSGKPPIIVALGPLALKAVGVHSKKIMDVVGRDLTTVIPSSGANGPHNFTVIPLLSIKHVQAKTGVAGVFMAALRHAFDLAIKRNSNVSKLGKDAQLAKITKDYVFPKTSEEVDDLVNMIIDYADANSNSGAEHHVVALDTETNTLRPYSFGDAKTLMVSVAWDKGKAATILVGHADSGWSDDDKFRVRESLQKLYACPKPKVFHNWKFDHKFLELLDGGSVNHVAWDTLLGEHYIDEDKKGLYSLKKLTTLYTPGYQGYDDELQKIFRDEEAQRQIRILEGDILKEVDTGWAPFALPDEDDLDSEDRANHTSFKFLLSVLRSKAILLAVKPANRTSKQKESIKGFNVDIRKCLKTLGIKRPTKENPKNLGIGTGEVAGFSSIPLDVIIRYAASDADVTRQIFVKQHKILRRTDSWEDGLGVMKQIYLPGSRVLSEMEYRGFAVDKERLDMLLAQATKRREEARDILKVFAPGVNFNNADNVAVTMTKLRFDPLPGEEQSGTGKELLKKYLDMYPPEDKRHQFVDNVINFRETHKIIGTYLEPIAKFSKEDGRVHCSFHLNGTATGRLSSSNPNLQNQVKIAGRRTKKINGVEVEMHPGFNLKSVFIPSKPGNVIADVDISGAELRVYTAYSNDEMMIKALVDGMDVHSYVTSMVYKIPYDEVMRRKREGDPAILYMRFKCKRVVFGTFYGAGPKTIAEQVNCSIEEAKELIQAIFAAFPALEGYVNKVNEEVDQNQYVKTLFGRRRRFKMSRMSYSLGAAARREAINFLIQSTSSDIVLAQLCEMSDNLHTLDGEMLLTVHDSMVMELPEENVGKLFGFLDHWIIGRVKERFPWLPVPFAYDVEVGPSYGEVKEIKRADNEKGWRYAKESAA